MANATNNHQYIQNASTSIGTGEFIPVKNASTLIISISGTSTSFTLLFQGALDDGNYFNIAGLKLADQSTLASSTSLIGEAWQFDVSALSTFKANLSAILNGNITVFTSISR